MKKAQTNDTGQPDRNSRISLAFEVISSHIKIHQNGTYFENLRIFIMR